MLASLGVMVCSAAATSWRVEELSSCPAVVPLRIETTGLRMEEFPGGVVPTVDDGLRSLEGGLPDLPFLARVVALPAGCEIVVEALTLETVETNVVSIAPVPTQHTVEEGDSARLAPARDVRGEVYSRDGLWPESVVDVTVAAQGTQRWARIRVHPVQVNPVTGRFLWHRVIDARLHVRGEP